MKLVSFFTFRDFALKSKTDFKIKIHLDNLIGILASYTKASKNTIIDAIWDFNPDIIICDDDSLFIRYEMLFNLISLINKYEEDSKDNQINLK